MFCSMNTPLTAAQGLSFLQVDPARSYLALQIQQQIWPHNPPDQDYLDKAYDLGDRANVNWLVYHHKNCIGLTGVFTYDPDEPGYDNNESIWMDWFAVLPEYRKAGLGRQILLATIAYAKSLDRFKYFRLDTADFSGRTSTFLYDQVMQLREAYTAEPIPDGHRELIYSYSLDGSPIKPWDNRLLGLNQYGAVESIVN